MKVSDLISDARVILIDTRSPYRWDDGFFVLKYQELIDLLWLTNVAYFMDSHGKARKTYGYDPADYSSSEVTLDYIIPLPDFLRESLSSYLISKAYAIDATDKNNEAREVKYEKVFSRIL